MFDEMKGHKTEIPYQICNNLMHLLTESKLNLSMLSELGPDIGKLYGVIRSDTASMDLVSKMPG